MDRGTERPTCPEEGRPESLSKNSWEEKKLPRTMAVRNMVCLA